MGGGGEGELGSSVEWRADVLREGFWYGWFGGWGV